MTDGEVDGAAQSGRHARRDAHRARSRSRGSRRRSSRPTNISASVLKLCQDRRGEQMELTYVGSRAMLVYELPLNEVVFDFYDRLKSVVEGLCQLRLSARPTTATAIW